MYWTDWEEDPKDSKRGKIERAWMDGSNRNIFITSKTVLWPNGLSLDIPAKILYWVDAFYDRIEMVYLNGTERKASAGSVGSWMLTVQGLGPWAAEPLPWLTASAAHLLGGWLATFNHSPLPPVPSCPFPLSLALSCRAGFPQAPVPANNKPLPPCTCRSCTKDRS